MVPVNSSRPIRLLNFMRPTSGQIVTFFVIEEAIQQGFNRFFSRWLTRTHHTVDSDSGGHTDRRVQIDTKGLGNISALIQIIRIYKVWISLTFASHKARRILSNYIVGFGDYFAGILIDDVFCQRTAIQEIFRYGNTGNPSSSISRMFLALIRLSFSTRTLPSLSTMSKRAISPRILGSRIPFQRLPDAAGNRRKRRNSREFLQKTCRWLSTGS